LRDESSRTKSAEKKIKGLEKDVAQLKKTIETPVSNGANAVPVPAEPKTPVKDVVQQPVTSQAPGSSMEPNSPSPKPIRVESLEGWLDKKGLSPGHPWAKRYFVLQGSNLSYYEDERKQGEPKIFTLKNATCFAHVEKKGTVKELFFNIRTEFRDLLLRASNKEEKDKWVSAIKGACVKGELTVQEKAALQRNLSRRSSSFIGKLANDDRKVK